MSQEERNEEERISRALQDVETPSYDIAAAVRKRQAEPTPKSNTQIPKRVALALAACLLLTLSVGAVYLTLSENWKLFFGESTIPSALVNPIRQSQTIDGYTLSVEDVLLDGSDGMVLLSLRRQDGGTIPEDIAFAQTTAPWIQVSLLQSDGSKDPLRQSNAFNSGETLPQRSQDGKTLYLCYAFSQDASLLGHSLTIQMSPPFRNEIIRCQYTLPTFTNIPRLPPGLTLYQEAALPILADLPALPLPETTKTGIVFRGFVQGDTSSYLVFSGTNPDWTIFESRPPIQEIFKDAQDWCLIWTARPLGADETYAWTLLLDFNKLPDTYFSGMPFDLGFVRSEAITQEGFSFSFTPQNSMKRTLDLSQRPLVVNGRERTLASMELSPLRLSFLTPSVPRDAHNELNQLMSEGTTFLGYPVLLLQDGSEIPTAPTVETRLREDAAQNSYYRVDYSFQDESGNRLFPDPNEVIAIRLGTLVLPLNNEPMEP